LKKRYKLCICILISLFVLLDINVYKTLTFTFNDLKHGTPIGDALESPDNKYSAIAYAMPYGGVDVRVEVINNKLKTKKTIYHADYKSDFELKWIDNKTLYIKNEDLDYNDVKSKKLNIYNDIYDETGSACRSLVLKHQYKNCFEE